MYNFDLFAAQTEKAPQTYEASGSFDYSCSSSSVKSITSSILCSSEQTQFMVMFFKSPHAYELCGLKLESICNSDCTLQSVLWFDLDSLAV